MERWVRPFNHGRVLHSPSEVKESPKPASTWLASPAWTSRCPCHLPDPPATPPNQLTTQWTQIRWSPSPALKSLMVPHVIQSKSESLPTCPTLTTCHLRLFCLSHAQHPPTPGPLHGCPSAGNTLPHSFQAPTHKSPYQMDQAGPSGPSGHSLCSCSVPACSRQTPT